MYCGSINPRTFIIRREHVIVLFNKICYTCVVEPWKCIVEAKLYCGSIVCTGRRGEGDLFVSTYYVDININPLLHMHSLIPI